MVQPRYQSALIVGAGPGLSASLARLFAANGLRVALSARDPAKLGALASETKASLHAGDASDSQAVERLFSEVEAAHGAPDLVVFNASGRVRAALVDLEPEAVRRAIEVSAFAGFLVTQQAARRMVPKRHGAIALTGATASVKGFPLSTSFAMGKFALRGLAQSAARELAPHGIHVAHFVIDGGIRAASRPDPADSPDSTLDPYDIAQTYWHTLHQPRSAWTWEVELRPWVEKF